MKERKKERGKKKKTWGKKSSCLLDFVTYQVEKNVDEKVVVSFFGWEERERKSKRKEKKERKRKKEGKRR